MPAPHPDDHAATRRDRFGKVDSKIANQTRLLVALNVLISSAMAAVIIRATG